MHNIKSVFKELKGVPYQMHVVREMQFLSHCYTVVSCQPILRHSVYKNSAVYLSGARVSFFFSEIRDLGSPTMCNYYWVQLNREREILQRIHRDSRREKYTKAGM